MEIDEGPGQNVVLMDVDEEEDENVHFAQQNGVPIQNNEGQNVVLMEIDQGSGQNV